MSWLRASRKLVDPDGVRWDVYVTRAYVGVPRRRLARVVARLAMPLPLAPVRARFGITRRVEAISDWPRPVTHAWQVEGPPGKLLLDEIARGLARGLVPEPAGAIYLGVRT